LRGICFFRMLGMEWRLGQELLMVLSGN
jgi:hypothetical protein